MLMMSLVVQAQASVVVFDNCAAYDMVTGALGIGPRLYDL